MAVLSAIGGERRIKMDQLDRLELNEIRCGMWEIFSRIAKTPENDAEINIFIRLMDRHQEILIKDGKNEFEAI
jgi:hypothetical protein